MSLVASVRTWLLTYDGLEEQAALLVDKLGKEPTQYALVPLPGAAVLETYLDDSTRRQFPFALQSMEFVANDEKRVATYEFYEGFAAWVESQNAAGTFPTLDDGKTPESVEILGQPILFEFGESGTGIYQIQCRVIYEQDAP